MRLRDLLDRIFSPRCTALREEQTRKREQSDADNARQTATLAKELRIAKTKVYGAGPPPSPRPQPV